MKKEEKNKNLSGDLLPMNYNLQYHSPAPKDQFPILAIGIMYTFKADIESSELEIKMNLFKGANLNVCLPTAMGPTPMTQWLNKANRVGINLILQNDLFFDGRETTVYDNNDNFGGYKLYDEPDVSQLLGTQTIKEDKNPPKKYYLPEQYKNLAQHHPSKIILINLVGQPDTKTGATYKDDYASLVNYIDTYLYYYNPTFLSYDVYPIHEIANLLYEGSNIPLKDSGEEGDIIVLDEIFYKALEIYSQKSKENNIPFWAFCESICYMNINSNFFRPIATKTFLRFEAFSALAYGAKAILYFTYSMRINSSSESYFSALLDRRDNITASYDFARNVNAEIFKYQDIFLNATGFSVTHVQAGSPGTIINSYFHIEINNTSDEKGVIFSLFTSEGIKYFMIVSKDVLNYQTINLKFYGIQVAEVTPLKSHVENDPNVFSNQPISRLLIPGGYRIFKYKT